MRLHLGSQPDTMSGFRPHLGVQSEPADHPLSGADGHLAQAPGKLLIAPAVQHRLEHARLRLAA